MPGDFYSPAISSFKSDTGTDWDKKSFCSNSYHLLAADLFACNHCDIPPYFNKSRSVPFHRGPGRISNRLFECLGKVCRKVRVLFNNIHRCMSKSLYTIKKRICLSGLILDSVYVVLCYVVSYLFSFIHSFLLKFLYINFMTYHTVCYVILEGNF